MPNIRNLETKHYVIIALAAAFALFLAVSFARLFLVVIPGQEAEETTDITSVESNKGDIGEMPSNTQGLYTVLLSNDWKSGDDSSSYVFSTTQMLSGDSVSDFAITHVVDMRGIGFDEDDSTSKIFTIRLGDETYDAAYYPSTDSSPNRVYCSAFSSGYIVPDVKVTLAFKGLDQLAGTCSMDQSACEELARIMVKKYYPTVTLATFTGDATSDLKTGRILAHVSLNDDEESELTFLSIPGKDGPLICNGSTDDFADTGFMDLESLRKVAK